jgi:uncharacterized CHY-type Zn-finger protein
MGSNPTGGMDVCLLCVLSGSLCDELITRPEESYRLWRVVMCNQETSLNEEAIARAGLQSQKKKINTCGQCRKEGEREAIKNYRGLGPDYVAYVLSSRSTNICGMHKLAL